jgi:hypothetical protein
MNVLDENFPDDQRAMLEAKRIRVRQIGRDLGRTAMKDNELIRLLHQVDRPTFFTLDVDFYDRGWRNEGYCLVYLDIDEDAAAEYVIRLLRHQDLNTKAKRMGSIIRVTPGGLAIWRIRKEREERLAWV